MGKSDFKKINDHWNSDVDSRIALDKYYNNTNEVSNGKTRANTKACKKSDHKHLYEKVVIAYVDKDYVGLGRKCQICGVVKIDKWVIFLKTKERHMKFATLKQVKEMEQYKNLRFIYMKDNREI